MFFSDPISSTAYATEEMLLVLVGAIVAGGALATGLALPVALAGTTALTGVEHALIPLYAVGVLTSFTLAQAGMTRRHLRLREPGWRSGIAINGIGAVVTAVALVLIVITITKFTHGAWMVVVAVPLLVWLLLRIQRTYSREWPSSRCRRASAWPRPSPATR